MKFSFFEFLQGGNAIDGKSVGFHAFIIILLSLGLFLIVSITCAN